VHLPKEVHLCVILLQSRILLCIYVYDVCVSLYHSTYYVLCADHERVFYRRDGGKRRKLIFIFLQIFNGCIQDLVCIYTV
jgi:hypothetical protein